MLDYKLPQVGPGPPSSSCARAPVVPSPGRAAWALRWTMAASLISFPTSLRLSFSPHCLAYHGWGLLPFPNISQPQSPAPTSALPGQSSCSAPHPCSSTPVTSPGLALLPTQAEPLLTRASGLCLVGLPPGLPGNHSPWTNQPSAASPTPPRVTTAGVDGDHTTVLCCLR